MTQYQRDHRTTPARGALNDRVYDHVVSQILIGAYPVDSRLPTEMQLAERLSVSRPVVRQALQRLKDDGLIVSRQGAGSFVIRRPAEQVMSFAAEGSVADVQKCFAFRIVLESEAAALAAEAHDAITLAALTKALEALEQALAEGTGGIEEDIAFHQAVVVASDNRFFVAAMAAITQQIRVGIGLNRSLTIEQPRYRQNAVREEHREIVAAIKARDRARSRRAMRHHLTQASRRLFEGGDKT